TQRPGRMSFFAGQLLALSVAVVAMVVVIFAFGALTSYAIASSRSETIDWPSLAEFVRGMSGGWLILMTWCLLGAMLAFFLRGTALSVGLGVVWILGIENLIVNVAAALLDFADTLQKGLPGVNAGSLVGALGDGGGGTPGVNTAVDGTQATLVLVAYATVFVIMAGVALQRRDVT
ncbi:MAG: ABC transporter permease, partial [Rubrobacteraceae bacterium]